MKKMRKCISLIICFLLCFSLAKSDFSVYAEENNIFEYSFIGKTMDELSETVTYSPNSTYPSTLELTSYGLTLTKNFSGADYGTQVNATVNFRKTIEEYSDETRAKSYQESFKGKYKITIPLKFHQKDRLSLTRLYISTPSGVSAPVFIRTAWNRLYIDGGATLLSGLEAGGVYNLNYEIDTNDNSSFYVYVDGGEKVNVPLTILGEDCAVSGVSIGFYNYGAAATQSLAGYTIERLEASVEEDTLEEAIKGFNTDSFCANPFDVTENLNLPSEYEGYSISWTSDKPEVISDKGVVTIPENRNEDVWLKAVVTDGYYERTKCFKLTVKKDPNTLEQLKTPVNLSWSDGVLSWDAVENATEYEISLNHNGVWENTYSTENCEFDFNDKFNMTGYYNATVTAKSEGYRDSVESALSAYYSFENLDDVLVYEETFDNKTLDELSQTVVYSQSGGEEGEIGVSDGMLALKKNTTGSGYGYTVNATVAARTVVEQYNDSTHSEIIQNKFKGKYRLDVGVKTNRRTFGLLIPVGSDFHAEVGNGKIGINSGAISKAYGDYNKVYNLSLDFDTEIPTSVFLSVDGENPVKGTAGGFGDAFGYTGLGFGFKSLSSAGDIFMVDYVRLHRLCENADEEDVLKAAQELDVYTLCDDPESVTSNVNLPDTFDDCSVTWSSSDIEYISNSGKFMKQSMESDKEVWMTAIISKNNHELTKRFKLTVPVDTNPDHVLAAAMEAVDYDNLISGNPNNLNENLTLPSDGLYGTSITWKSSAPEYVSDDGKVLKYDTESKKSVAMTATFSYGDISKTKVFNFMLSVPFEPDYTFFEAENPTDSDSFTDDHDKFVYVYPTFGNKKLGPNGNLLLELELKADEITDDVEYEVCDLSGDIAFKIGVEPTSEGKICTIYAYDNNQQVATDEFIIDSNSESIELSCHINYYDSQLSVGVNKTEGQNITAISKKATALGFIKTSALSTIKKMSVKMPTAEALSTVLVLGGYLRGVESADSILTEDLILPSQSVGNFNISWHSSDPEVLGNDGKFVSNNITEDKTVTLTATCHMADKPEITLSKEYTFKVRYRDYSNLALSKPATSDATSGSGHIAQKVTDGYFDTYWQTAMLEKSPELIIDLEKDTVLNSVIIQEGSVSGKYNIKKWKLEASADASKWTTIFEGDTLGENKKILNFETINTRYLRFVAVETDGNIAISEIQAFCSLNDLQKAEFDLKMLKDDLGSLRGLTQSINLPEKGSFWNSSFTYDSSKPDSLSDMGRVERQSKNVSGVLKVTATNGAESAVLEIPFTVSASSSGTSSGGSSGSSKGFSGSPGYVEIPKTDNSDLSNVTGIGFLDVPRSHWAYEYVANLKKSGIVSGNGNGYFYPENNITREEFLKMLIEALNITASSENRSDFEDVATNEWYCAYVNAGVNAGITSGISQSHFGTGLPITRQDMAVMLVRAFEYKEINISDVKDISGFSDVDAISDYALDSVMKMKASGYIGGYPDGNFYPNENATRAEAAKIISFAVKG